MLGVYPIISLTIAILFTLLGLLILLNRPRAGLNRTFFAISVSTGLWLVLNSIAGSAEFSIGQIVLVNRITFFVGLMAVTSLLLFAYKFTEYNKRKLYRSLMLLSGVGMILSLSPLVVSSAVISGTTNILRFGPLTPVYAVSLVSNCLIAIWLFIRYNRRALGIKQKQTRQILHGFSTSLAVIIVTNVILPMVFNIYALVPVGPLTVSFIIASIAASMISHQLFDIRPMVARFVGYLLSIGVLSLIYGFITFNLISELFFKEIDLSIWQRTVYTVLAVIIAFTFQPLKRFFSKWSNKIFYQDAYDGQALIDQLNKTLVTTIDLSRLLKGSATILESNMKMEFCVFVLTETDHAKQRIIDNTSKKLSGIDDVIKNLPAHTGSKILLASTLDDSYKELRDQMNSSGIEATVRLTQDAHTEGVGYMMLGGKKSGSIYTSRDAKVLEIVANSMVIAIDNALRFEEIQQFNITLQEKINEATHQLRRTNEKLRALDETKDEFISMASHQLRTPLTSVKGYVSMVLEGDAGRLNKMQKKLLDQSFVSSQRMVYLIADLLNVSRLKTGKFIIEAKETNLADVVEGEIEQLVETAKGRGLDLTYEKPKSFPLLLLDETKIRQVIMNFVDNAIYYTPSGGHINVSMIDTGKVVEFTVTDDGIGVPKHEQHHLFSKFFRAGNAKKARPDGTGLGLFMAQKVVMAQGGAIIFHSEEGKGSTFGFSFAKDRITPPPSPKTAHSVATRVAVAKDKDNLLATAK